MDKRVAPSMAQQRALDTWYYRGSPVKQSLTGEWASSVRLCMDFCDTWCMIGNASLAYGLSYKLCRQELSEGWQTNIFRLKGTMRSFGKERIIQGGRIFNGICIPLNIYLAQRGGPGTVTWAEVPDAISQVQKLDILNRVEKLPATHSVACRDGGFWCALRHFHNGTILTKIDSSLFYLKPLPPEELCPVPEVRQDPPAPFIRFKPAITRAIKAAAAAMRGFDKTMLLQFLTAPVFDASAPHHEALDEFYAAARNALQRGDMAAVQQYLEMVYRRALAEHGRGHVVYTPPQVVRAMCSATVRKFADPWRPGLRYVDFWGGCGNFLLQLMGIMPPEILAWKYHDLRMIEIDPAAAETAARLLTMQYRRLTGRGDDAGRVIVRCGNSFNLTDPQRELGYLPVHRVQAMAQGVEEPAAVPPPASMHLVQEELLPLMAAGSNGYGTDCNVPV